MASQPRGRENPMFKTKTPHFFKVILDDTIRERKLGIPKLFVRKYGNQLPSPVHLEVPSGQVWKVELTKCDSKVWLQKGWHQFAEHYSLESGHFVVFRYKGNARFDVVIFDRTASEIEYPYIRREVDGTSKCKKRKEKSDMPCTQPQKKMKFNSSNKSGSGINLNPKIVASDAKGKGVESPELEVLKKVTFFTSAEKNEALQKASGFRSKNPFFPVVMQPSYISSRTRMSIPVSFARKYFKIPIGTMILCCLNGRTWPATYYCTHNRDSPQLLRDWEAFAKYNALKAGDVCIFELTKMRPDIVLNVVIYPVVELANAAMPLDELKASAKHNDQGMSGSRRCLKPNLLGRMQQPSTPTKKKRALEPASAFLSTNPSFTVKTQPSYLTCAHVNIPYQFAMSYFKENGEVTLRVSDGRTWIVDYFRKVYGSYPKAVFVHKSWRAFALDNNLKVGDVCAFELINANRIMLDVVIFRAADGSYSSKLEEADDDVSIEILGETAPCKKMRERSPIQCPRPLKMMKNMTHKTEKILESASLAPHFRPYGNKAREVKIEKLKGSKSSSSSKQGGGHEPCKRTGRGMGSGWECPEQAEILRFSHMAAEEKAKPLQIAKSFNSKNPFFLAVIQSTHARRYMGIPNNFTRKFLTKRTGGEVTLCLPNGKSWAVKYRRRACHGNPKAKFNGWKKFAMDNRLVVGDICVFELLDCVDITLKVVIHRVADVASCETSQGPEFLKRYSYLSLPAPGAAVSRFASSIPLFKKVMKPSFVGDGGRMGIPYEFIKEHFKPDTEIVILQVADKSWSTKFIVDRHHGIGQLTSGWMKFARENSLKTGDVCVFKLMITSSHDAILNVSITRKDG